MNWVDLVIFIFLLLFALEGLSRGFVGEGFDFLSFLLSFFLSFRFYNWVADFFEKSFSLAHSLSNVLGFIFVWFLTEVIFFTLLHLFLPKIKFPSRVLKVLNPLAFIPALLRGLVFIALILILIATFPIQPKLKQAVNESKMGSVILANTARLEGPIKQIFGGITQDTFSFLTIKPKSNESVNLGFQTSKYFPNVTLEKRMIDLVNMERAKQGLKTLAFNQNLTDIARAHSADMFERGYFSHYSPEGKTVADRAAEHQISYVVIGENLAYAPTLELAHNGLMNSPGHRANILSPDFGEVGIGVMDGGVFGLMITQVFRD